MSKVGNNPLIKNKKKEIILEYDSKYACDIWGYKTFLEFCILNDEKIPARVLKKFFSFFTLPEEEQKRQLNNRLKLIEKNTIARFDTIKNYSFVCKIKNGNEEKIVTLKNIIEKAFQDLQDNHKSIWDKAKHEEKKEELSFFIFTSLCYYRELLLNKNYKQILSNYKLYIITSFIINNLGFATTKKNPTNKKLFDDIRYILNKTIKDRGFPSVDKLGFPILVFTKK